MSGYLKYYAKEHARHKDAHAQSTDIRTCVKMAHYLFKHFNVPAIPVGLPDRKRHRVRMVKSWYNSKAPQEIVLHPNMLNPLTVAHEVAHYVHDHRYLARKRSGSTRARGRWHGVEHRSYTDAGVAVLRNHNGYAKLFGPKPIIKDDQMVSIPWVQLAPKADPVSSFFAALPQSLHCPKCGTDKNKVQFGVRVMKRDAKGVPVVIRRQSYCKDCR